MKRLIATVTVFFLAGVRGSAAPVGFSWDSSGPCSAYTIASGTPCVLNEAARATAARSGHNVSEVDLPDVLLSEGLSGPLGGLYAFDVVAEFTARWQSNELWWVDVDTASSGRVIAGGQGMGTHVEAWIPDNAFFAFRNPARGDWFESLLQPAQFSAWHTERGVNFLGIEDIASAFITPEWTPYSGDRDYNDLVVSFHQVPEPTSLLLFGLGLTGLAIRLRRDRR